MKRLVTALRCWDHQIMMEFIPHRRNVLNRAMAVITLLGDGWLWLAIVLGLWIFGAGTEKVIYQTALALSLEFVIYKAMKQIFSRLRPFQSMQNVTCIVEPTDRYSFPSGHTAAAFAVAGILGASYNFLFPPLLLLACLIGFSRIYLGAHYPSDVAAGALLGWFCADFARWFVM